MFLNDDDFDEPDVDVPISRFAQVRRSAAGGPPGPRGGGISMLNSKDQEYDDDDDGGDDDGFDGSGGSGGISQSASRARMLAQQREILMKKRQDALETGGMIRSSLDASGNSPVRRSSEHQFTPAVRQFSAPKSVKDQSADASDTGSEFTRPSRQPIVVKREEEAPPPRKPVRKDKDFDAKPSRRRDYDDEEEEENDNYHRGSSRRSEGKPKKSSSRYDDEEADDSHATNARGGRRGPGYESTNWDEDDKPRRRKDEEGDSWGAKPTSRTPERAVVSKPAVRPLDLSNMRSFLTSPLPKDAGVVQCYIRRNKSGTNKLFPAYTLYLKDGDRFLMMSKKRPNNKTSNYLISMGENDLNRASNNYLGKLRSNFMGTEFQIFDDGYNPKEERGGAGSHVRRELGGVMYQANVLGNRGPRKMQVAIPSVDESGRAMSSPTGAEDIVPRIKDRNLRDLSYLINKPPRWNEQVNAYVLNFNGRVTMASVKNFQLVDPDEHNIIVLQFGRVGKDEFTMDMHYPISPLQAFAITMSSFDSKIACD